MSPDEPPVKDPFAESGCSPGMETAPKTVVRFPSERVPRAAVGGVTWLQIYRGRVREWVGRSLNKIGAPGAIRDMNLKDDLTGQHVSVELSVLYVRLTVNDRDYYFDRITGRFDGTGAAP